MMKKILFLVMLIPMLMNAQTISFTDPVLKAKLLSASPDNTIAYGGAGYIKIDANNNNEIEVSEAMAVDSLDIRQLSEGTITNLTGISNFLNLKKLDISYNFIEDVQLTLPELKILIANGAHVSTIGLNSLPNLEILDCQLNNIQELDVSMCSNLTNLNCSYNAISLLTVAGLGNLQVLDCHWNSLTALNLSGLSSLQRLYLASNMLTTLDISPLSNIQVLDCSTNNLNAVLGTSATLNTLSCNGNLLTSMDVLAFPQLNTLNCSANLLTSLNIAGHASLTQLSCAENDLETLDLTGCGALTSLGCQSNLLTNLQINNHPNLQQLQASNNQLSNISFSVVPNLTSLNLSNNLLTTIDVAPLTGLTALTLNFNLLATLTGVSQLVNLTSMQIVSNQLTSVNFSGANSLYLVDCSNNQFTDLDFSQNDSLIMLRCKNNPNLSFINIKNGIVNDSSVINGWSENPSLTYVCTDDDEIDIVQQIIVNSSLTNVNINSYCSFTPGGDHNTISGHMFFDSQQDGCDPTETAYNYMKLHISDGTESYSSFTDAQAEYLFHTEEGTFTVTPQIENPTIFNISPASHTVNFATVDNLVSVNDFCITPNGVHPDLEIVVLPIMPPRPGFDAIYQIVYKNKGNQTLSQQYGISFFYDQNLQDVIMSTPNAESAVPGALAWSYTDLKPFETRSISVVMNINAPTEENPVNIDDVLTYTASILPMAGDDTTADNLFELNQVVVGSYDPNDITCLQGETVDPAEIGEYLHYVVNFENTGTAPAENVVIKIIIDESLYNLSSLQLMYGSHAVTAKVTGNIAEFIFSNILLDSGGHGNILLKIRSAGNLTIGDSVLKYAAIYFDYNFPVITNDAETAFQTLSIDEHATDSSVKIYPNPTEDVVRISAAGEILSVELFDANGRILLMLTGGSGQLNLSQFSTGLYFVKVKTTDGVAVQKLIKK